MKKINFYIPIILLLSCFGQLCQAQSWTPNWQYQSKAYNVKFIDANTGFMSFMPHDSITDGSGIYLLPTYGILLKTSNGALSWSEQKFDSLPRLLVMDFADINNGIIGAQGIKNGTSTILRTTNGGTSWSNQPMAGIRFSDMDMINSTNIVMVGQKVTGTIASKDTSLLLSSNDGGQNWTRRKLSFRASCVSFLDNNLGFMASPAGKIYKTTDAGANWVLVHSSSEVFNEMYFNNSQVGFVISAGGKVLSTTNGGANWDVVNIGTYNLKSIDFSSDGHGYICTTAPGNVSDIGYVFKTTNSGASWVQSLRYNKPLASISFATSQLGYSIGDLGHLIKTIDGGQSWKPIMGLAGIKGQTADIAGGLHFPTNNTGYVVSASSVTKTTNAGQSWLSSSVANNGIQYSVFFTDSLIGYSCGYNGFISKTTNGGQSWQRQNSNGTFTLNEIYFVSATTGYIAGGKWENTDIGVVLKTTNGGANWSMIYTTDYILNTIVFTSPQIGYAGGDGGIFKTTNAGQSWQIQADYLINSIAFKNPDVGFAVLNSNPSPVLSTTNAGVSWQELPSWANGGAFYYNSVYCNSNDCYMAGVRLNANLTLANSSIMSNSGLSSTSWEAESLSVAMQADNGFSTVFITPNQTAYALHTMGMILKKYDHPTSNKPKAQNSRPALAFELYPNPSSGQATLETSDWQRTGFVVMDVLGRSIQAGLLNSNRTRLDLPKGVYFVRLSGPSGQGMKKIVVE